jgi:hypothetical protein
MSTLSLVDLEKLLADELEFAESCGIIGIRDYVENLRKVFKEADPIAAHFYLISAVHMHIGFKLRGTSNAT